MLIQLVAIIVLTTLALGSFLVYNRMNRTHYIEYTEGSKIDYQVRYRENSFFEDEWIGANQTYISSLIDEMTAKFSYCIDTDASDLKFGYRYKIDAKMLVANKDNGVPYYTFEENILPKTETGASSASKLQISEEVAIDYVKYNRMATTFIDTYNLENVSSCTLVVTLDVEILSSSKQLNTQSQSGYSTSVNIPLAVDTFNVHTTSSSPSGEVKVLEYKDVVDRQLFYISSIVALSLDVLLVLTLLFFMQLTKNEDVTYAAKINKILRSYGSFIQRIDGDFCADEYQTVMIKTFTEMLGIRDTIQSPILMSENRDETLTRFLIPTNTKILYTYEIKVDNFDQIYAIIEEPVILAEDIDADELSEALAQPDAILSEIEYIPDDDDQYEVAPEEPGVEVIGVVWPERAHKNKVYRYDPNGEQLQEGDVVLVPTTDVAHNRSVIRKAAVAHANHRVDPDHIKKPLKQIIAVIKRKIAINLASETDAEEANNETVTK